jgi:site-specific DNA recombinase
MKTFIYCRKSTESEDRQVLSIPAQVDELRKLAEREGITVDAVFTESMSAKAPGRPTFEKLIQEVKKNPGATLLAWKLDRLARNPVDGGTISWLLQQGVIAEIKTYERSYFPTDNVLMMSVELGMANQFVRDLSVNVKRGLRQKLERGGWIGIAPLGYYNDKADHTVKPDPLRHHFVTKAFELFSTGGYSLKDVATLLYADGLRTPKGYKVHMSVLHRTILNPFYTGVIARSGKLYQGAHKPLVSKDVWEQCQSVLKGNRSKKRKHMIPLRGYLNCAECGCMITASIQRGHQYYHCTNGKGSHTAKRAFVRSENLNARVAEKFKELQFDVELVQIMYQAAKEKSGWNAEFLESAKKQAQQQLALAAQKLQRAEDAYIDGSMPKDRYTARILDLDNEAVALHNQLKQLETKLSTEGDATIEQTKKAFLTGIFAEKDFLCGDDLKKRELSEILLSNIVIRGGEIIKFQYKQPFQIMAETKKPLQEEEIFLWQGL